MRLVYTADLHGDIGGYRALLDLAVAKGAGAAIVGGDLLPHVFQRDQALQVQRAFVETKLQPLLQSFQAEHSDVGVYLLAGNDDWAGAIAVLDDLERDGLAFPLHERVYTLRSATYGLWLAGYACVPLTPFSIKDYERYDDAETRPAFSFDQAYTSTSGELQPASEADIAAQPSIAEDMENLAQRSDPQRTIYVCHTPPFGTPLDQMARERHVGSRSLRVFIERHAPPLTLHGHIHEAPALSGQYAVRLGKTWSVNPGNDPRRFHAVALDTDGIAGTIEHTIFGRLNV